MGPHETKKLLYEKGHHHWQAPEWEEIFINSTFDKGLISKMYKEFENWTSRKQPN